jgi:MerR family transcriptional regulator, light-induced transcriptional regulator
MIDNIWTTRYSGGARFLEDHMPPALRYPIAAAARLTGLSLDTIRAWERRYGAVVPQRGARGRVYTDAQVQRLRTLSALVGLGHPISEVAVLPDPRLDELLRRTMEGQARPARREAAPGGSPISRVVAAIDAFDYAAADREVARLASLYPPRDLVHQVALPLMRLVGERWHAGELTIAQEHMLSAILHAVMAGLVRLQGAPDAAPRLLFATPEAELHEFGILAGAMLAASAGLGVVYLGPNVPATDIGDAARRIGAAAVVLGLTGGSPTIAKHLSEVRRAVPAETEVWIGGPATLPIQPSQGSRGRVLPLVSFDEFERHLRRLGGRS